MNYKERKFSNGFFFWDYIFVCGAPAKKKQLILTLFSLEIKLLW